MQAVAEYFDLDRNDHPAWEEDEKKELAGIQDENDPDDPLNRLDLLRTVVRDSVARSLWGLDAKAKLLADLAAEHSDEQEHELALSLAGDITRILEEEKAKS